MNDLFYREQQILSNARKHINELKNGAPLNQELFEQLINEYGIILSHLQKVIKISDKASRIVIDERKFGQERINKLEDDLLLDVLTGIYNRRYMEKNLNGIIKTMQRSGGGMLSIMMIDIDYFKQINDTYGHAVGDECLRIVAKAIEGSITRDNDFVARYGGEEFVVALSNTDECGASIIAKRILENVRKLNIPHEKSIRITVSIGSTTGDVKEEQTITEYVKRADDALYISKKNGRDSYTFLDLSN
ncbi:MAG: GGDEF domain-containing protein [Spirochaetaceae bacterium]|nr:GGDEF domain-containing protein [Spirochaetaceae bacterium]